jgi:hypothetical protein
VIVAAASRRRAIVRALGGANAIRSVRVQARDKRYGYGGKTVDVPLPGR